MSNARFGLSIGTQNIGISSISTRQILFEKNAIAVRNKNSVIAYGNDAYDIFEKNPEDVEVIFPVADSVISDIAKLQFIMEGLYKKLNNGKLLRGSEFLIAVPTGITEVEKRAFHELAANSKIKPRNISVVEKIIADSVDCGIDPKDPHGNMIVNIGADTTEIAVVSLGKIIENKTIKVAGNRFSELIMSAVKQSESKLIGFKSAESLKKQLVDFTPERKSKVVQLYGRYMATGLPSKVLVSSELVTDAVLDSLLLITEDIKRVLEKTPSELNMDVRENGIYLVGGSSSLKGIGKLFAEHTGIKINIVDEPAVSTIRGVTRIFRSSRFDCVRYYPEEKVYY